MRSGRTWIGWALSMRALHNTSQTTSVIVEGEPLRVQTTPVVSRGKVIGAVQAAHPLFDVQQAIANVNQTLLALIPVGLLFAGLAGAAVTTRALQPVGQIALSADRIDAEDLRQRLDVVGADEFSQLAMTFNRMLDRLETAFGRQRSLVSQLESLLVEQKRFTADASHELKTPLAIAKVHSGLLLRLPPTASEYLESVQSIDDSVDRMNRLVQDLLLLAQADAGMPCPRGTSLGVRDLLEQARHLNRSAAGPPIRLDGIDPALAVPGNEDELVRVFSNLFANALRHTPQNGEIRVDTRLLYSGVIVRIMDTGDGIAPEHLSHLGERFYRVDSSRARNEGGAGLGLSICKRLIEQHNGSLAFESIVGVGTSVIVTLPAQGPDGIGQDTL